MNKKLLDIFLVLVIMLAMIVMVKRTYESDYFSNKNINHSVVNKSIV